MVLQRKVSTTPRSTAIQLAEARPVSTVDRIDAHSEDLFESLELKPLMKDMDRLAGRANWAFAGSFAMYIWARWAHTSTRRPNDIDVVVKKAKWNEVAYDLYSRGEKKEVKQACEYPPSTHNPHPTYECYITATGVKLDLHSHDFADSDVAHYGKNGDIPVLRKSLIRAKLESRARDTFDIKRGQAAQDLQTLAAIEQAYNERYSQK